MNKEYFNYLVQKINGQDYINLLSELHQTHFYPLIELDKNRVTEAKENLRDGLPYSPRTEYISIFELLVSLAIEHDNRVRRHNDKNNTANWFWLFMCNCSLNIYDDIYFSQKKEYCLNKIHEWCSIFNNRTYRRDGFGSPFPLNNPPKDMRKTELFYQLCWYINENN